MSRYGLSPQIQSESHALPKLRVNARWSQLGRYRHDLESHVQPSERTQSPDSAFANAKRGRPDLRHLLVGRRSRAVACMLRQLDQEVGPQLELSCDNW